MLVLWNVPNRIPRPATASDGTRHGFVRSWLFGHSYRRPSETLRLGGGARTPCAYAEWSVARGGHVRAGGVWLFVLAFFTGRELDLVEGFIGQLDVVGAVVVV